MKSFESMESYGESALSKESIEGVPRQHYLFTNNDISDHPVVFECYAESDDDAEKQYKNKMGKSRENTYIGMSIVIN
jgi:hypothetical protein